MHSIYVAGKEWSTRYVFGFHHHPAGDMAKNVFGDAITDETLKGMEYKITRINRAHEALNMMNDGLKHKAASDYVQGLKADYGDGVSTLCLFYNATGDPLTLVDTRSWQGYFWEAMCLQVIENGQGVRFCT